MYHTTRIINYIYVYKLNMSYKNVTTYFNCFKSKNMNNIITNNNLSNYYFGNRIIKNLNKCFSVNNKSVLIKNFSSSQKIPPNINLPQGICPKYSYTSDISFKSSTDKIPIFRALDSNGNIINKDFDKYLDKETAIKMLNNMVLINIADPRFNMAQREGKISFYMTCLGEEAAITGSIAACEMRDSVYPQYREASAILYRGYSIQDFANQLVGNYLDAGKGRQMPVHVGSNKLNYHTVSSPLSTQLPQASGAGYNYRVKKEDKICITYFGEGAASEGDFHAALNFASVLRSQTIFFCRNNKYAISTSIQDQYKGDGIAVRGIGYGMRSIRVDGNDALGVYVAVKEARRISIGRGVPVLVEAMTFRRGDHSTSDASIAYRNEYIMKGWEEYLASIGNPIKRFESYLLSKNWIDKEYVKNLEKKYKIEVRDALKSALKLNKPSIDSMFDDVYEELPQSIRDQKKELKEYLESHASIYDLQIYNRK